MGYKYGAPKVGINITDGRLPCSSSASMFVELSPVPTLVSGVVPEKSIVVEPQSLASARPLRKYALLAIFCLGQFLDTMNNSAILPALPAVTHSVGLTESDSVWLLAAYQATFASFLLIVGTFVLNLPTLKLIPFLFVHRAVVFQMCIARNQRSSLALRSLALSRSVLVLSTIASC